MLLYMLVKKKEVAAVEHAAELLLNDIQVVRD